ncbi:MAG: hypothetical protein H0U76_14380 [Ktedonobacteraceae bacterium]|nr:hypothetical protein [Ktedonobacteraceae bacterium]
MATILLTDDEYTHIKTLMTDLLSKAEIASPRAATHYATLAQLSGNFLANEDAKRAKSQTRASTRETIKQTKEKRRSRVHTAPTAQPQGAARPSATPKSA